MMNHQKIMFTNKPCQHETKQQIFKKQFGKMICLLSYLHLLHCKVMNADNTNSARFFAILSGGLDF